MDPITVAIIAAVAGGVTQTAVVEGYNRLKKLIKDKFGSENNLSVAIDKL